MHIRRKAFERKFESIVEAERQRRKGRKNSRDQRSLAASANNVILSSNISASKERVHESKTALPVDENARVLAISKEEQLTPSNRVPPSNGVPEDKASLKDIGRDSTNPDSSQTNRPQPLNSPLTHRITFANSISPIRERHHGKFLSMQGVGARQDIQNHPSESPRAMYPNIVPRTNAGNEGIARSESRTGMLISRNSQFAGLTLAERDRLGGVEYRAISMLAFIVPAYFIMWQLLGCIGLGAYIHHNRAAVTAINAENPWYGRDSGSMLCSSYS